MKYLMEVFWSGEDKGYIAVVPDLPGCSARGETPEEAVREVRKAAAVWLETYTSTGDPAPKPTVRRKMWPRV